MTNDVDCNVSSSRYPSSQRFSSNLRLKVRIDIKVRVDVRFCKIVIVYKEYILTRSSQRNDKIKC
eukprot:762420-Hanusia_phi.AAC.2